MIKEIIIRAYLDDEGKIQIETEKSESMFESFELLGVYEFIKKEIGNKPVSILLVRISYSENGLGIHHKILKYDNTFLIKDVCNRVIKNEIDKIHKRLTVKRKLI